MSSVRIPTQEACRSERRRRRSRSQRIKTLALLVVVWLLGFGVLGLVVFQDSVPAEDLLMDRSTVAGQPWYTGAITALGVLAWTVATSGCAFAAWVAHVVRRGKARFAFGYGAFVFATLLADDLFRFHSDLLPRHTGVPKAGFLMLIIAFAISWVFACWPELQRTRWELLASALGGLGGSVLYDLVRHGPDVGTPVLIEDGLKFLGLLALATWSVASTVDLTRSAIKAGLPASTDRTTSFGKEPAVGV